jgi:hypothetical protein
MLAGILGCLEKPRAGHHNRPGRYQAKFPQVREGIHAGQAHANIVCMDNRHTVIIRKAEPAKDRVGLLHNDEIPFYKLNEYRNNEL